MGERRMYRLVCCECGAEYDDDGLRLSCENSHGPSLLRTVYRASGFSDWLPIVRPIPDAAAPVAYRAEGLGRVLGLTDLWVSFSGHWPERGAHHPTASFKDLEASTVLGRLPDDPPVLVLASAGNTAAAFAHACSRQGVRCLIIVPESALWRLAVAGARSGCARVVAVNEGVYDDAIALAEAVGGLPGFQLEGGIRNVGRRDGLATCLLMAFGAAGRLPDHYVQAVGSGAGAVAAHEAAERLRSHGCPDLFPRLLLCQNAPYAPLYNAWHGLVAASDPLVGPHSVFAPELTNGRPPFAVRGGVRDALTDSGGTVVAVENDAAKQAMAMFEEIEGTDIEPAASVALAGLAQSIELGHVRSDDTVLLNITGGGRRRLHEASRGVCVEPDLRVEAAATRDAALLSAAAKNVATSAFPRAVPNLREAS